MICNFQTIIFPIYGCMLGVNYYDSNMEDDTETDLYKENEYMIQLMFLFIGVSFVWYKKN